MPRIKILLVEDDSLVAKDIMQILESYNYEVYCIGFSDNDVAGKALENDPDLVLLDLKGDATNLNKFLSALQDMGVPSVILTDEDDDQSTGFKQKYGFLKKPYDPVDLRNIIEVALYAHEMDLKLKRSENRYKNILKNIQDAYIRTDNEGTIVMASPSAALMFRYNSPEEMIGTSAFKLYKYPENRQFMVDKLRNHDKIEDYQVEAIRKDGTSFWTFINSQLYSGSDKYNGTESFLHDITEHKIAEGRINKLSRLYATLSQINQAVVRIKDIESLYKTICEVCVKFGKFKMAWIGIIEPETGDIKPVEHYGYEDGYLESVKININDQTYHPSIKAIKTGEFVLTADFGEELNSKWRDEYLKRDYNSLASLPLILKNEAIGILNIYSSEHNFFTEEEIDLVKEMNMDISFAIESIERERERRIFADALTESETNYRELVDNSIVAIYKTDLEGNIIFANNALVDLFKFGNQKNIMEINVSQLYKNSQDRKNLIKIIKEEGKVKQYEAEMVSNTGEVMDIHLSAKLTGNIISGMLMNYTELKKVERELILSQEEWENTFNAVPDLIFILDTGHTILNCNKSMANKLGLKPEECIGLKCHEIVHGLDAPPIFCPQTKLVKDSNEHTTEMQEDTLNGNFIVSVTPLKEPNGKLIGSVHIARDITSRKLAEERLKESENRYRKVGELISDFAYSCVHNESGDYEIDWITNSFFNITGYKRKELELQGCWLFTVHPEDEEISFRQLKSIKPGEISVEDFRIINSKGEVRWLKNHVECVEDTLPGKLRIYGAAQDTTEINQALKELKQSEEKFKAIINNSSDIIRILDKNGKVIFDSPASERILGYPSEFLTGTDLIELIHPDDVEVVKNNLKKVYENKNHRTPIEFRIKKADGTYLPVESIAQNMFHVPNVGGIVVNTHPIKERKEMENEIKSSLREKEILLKEIHHRVKNNMQIISSLLNLQKEYVEEEEAVNVLQESQNRVKTMSLIHEKLYQSNDIAHINIAEYIENLVNDLFYSYAIKREKIKSVLEINEIKLNIETALPCGLIISELVSNTLKYAFPDDKKGELKVSLVRKGDGFLLIIDDNGVGLPEDIDFKNTDSLGMQLVINLVEQLEGEITLDNSNGSKFLITFQELHYKERI